jgi:glycine dehydrogenase subunit 2
LAQASGDAVLNANYVMARLSAELTRAFDGPCMHECVFDDRFLKGTGVTTLDIAKALIDEGVHPPTMYFPLVVHGALLIEPTETESKETLDNFIQVMAGLLAESRENPERMKGAPYTMPVRRLDDVKAVKELDVSFRPAA